MERKASMTFDALVAMLREGLTTTSDFNLSELASQYDINPNQLLFILSVVKILNEKTTTVADIAEKIETEEIARSLDSLDF